MFKVGSTVITNSLASKNYTITKKGMIGTITLLGNTSAVVKFFSVSIDNKVHKKHIATLKRGDYCYEFSIELHHLDLYQIPLLTTRRTHGKV